MIAYSGEEVRGTVSHPTMSHEQKFKAAVNVIQNLPKDGKCVQ